MAKLFSALFIILAAAQMMQAAPTPSPVLPLIFQAAENLGAATSDIVKRVQENIRTNRETARAGIEQVLQSVGNSVAVINQNRQMLHEGIAEKIAEIQQIVRDTNDLLRTAAQQTVPAVRQDVQDIVTVTVNTTNEVLTSIITLARSIRKDTTAAVVAAIQNAIDAKVNAAHQLVTAVRDFVRGQVNSLDFDKARAQIAESLLEAASRIVDVTAPIAIAQVQLATELVTYARQIVDTISETAANASTNLGEVKADLKSLEDYLQEIARNPENAVRSNAVVQEIVERVNQLLRKAIESIRKVQ